MNKKTLIILVIAIAVVLAAGIFAYSYFNSQKSQAPNFAAENEIKTEPPSGQELGTSGELETPQVEMQAEVQGTNGGGGLTVCQDKCGDGICQAPDLNCKNNFNCVCPEAKTDCPQDCK